MSREGYLLQNHVWQYLEKKQHSAISHIVYVTVQASHNIHHLQYEVHTSSASKLTTHTHTPSYSHSINPHLQYEVQTPSASKHTCMPCLSQVTAACTRPGNKVASFPGLPQFCSLVCVQYNTQRQKSVYTAH